MSFLRALHSLYNLIFTSLSLASHLSENKILTFPRKYASLTENPSLNHDTIIFSIWFIKPGQILLNITITHLTHKKKKMNMQFPSYMCHLKKTVLHYKPQKCAKLWIKFDLQLKICKSIFTQSQIRILINSANLATRFIYSVLEAMVLIAGSWEREIGLIRKSWLRPHLSVVVCDLDHGDLNTKRLQSPVIAFQYELGHFIKIFSISISSRR